MSSRMKRLTAAAGILAALSAMPTAGTSADPPQDAAAVRPLLVGSEVPDAHLEDERGEALSLGAIVEKSPALIVFYRGGW